MPSIFNPHDSILLLITSGLQAAGADPPPPGSCLKKTAEQSRKHRKTLFAPFRKRIIPVTETA